MAEKQKPQTYQNFEELTKRLMAVPKKELDKKIQTYEAAKRKRRKPSR